MKLKIMFPHPPGAGGPGSFQVRFEQKLKENGNLVLYKGDLNQPDLVFVVGGTTKLFWLFWMRLKGLPIIYRLDGIRWLYKKKQVSLKYYWLVDLYNKTSKAIHAILATTIVYQSQFVKDWWDKEGWRKRKNTHIIHNGVRIPEKEDIDKAIAERSLKRLVILEGVIDYTPYAVRLLNDLATNLPKDIQIEVYGKFEKKSEENKLHSRLQYKGFLDRKDVYKVFMGSVYLSLDIHPACPNTVAEALACGAPVVAFDTGALPELVDDSCGKIVAYGSNPWELGYPDVKKLNIAIVDVFKDYTNYSEHAYRKAKTKYHLEDMFRKYEKLMHQGLE